MDPEGALRGRRGGRAAAVGQRHASLLTLFMHAHRARASAVIATPYFVPTTVRDRRSSPRSASTCGSVPEKSDSSMVNFSGLVVPSSSQRRGIGSFPLIARASCIRKEMLIDDTVATVGTASFENAGSLLRDHDGDRHRAVPQDVEAMLKDFGTGGNLREGSRRRAPGFVSRPLRAPTALVKNRRPRPGREGRARASSSRHQRRPDRSRPRRSSPRRWVDRDGSTRRALPMQVARSRCRSSSTPCSAWSIPRRRCSESTPWLIAGTCSPSNEKAVDRSALDWRCCVFGDVPVQHRFGGARDRGHAVAGEVTSTGWRWLRSPTDV